MSNETQGGGIVGLIVGLVGGALLGYGLRHFVDSSVAAISIGALLVGAFGYFFGDRFWLWLGRNLGWFT